MKESLPLSGVRVVEAATLFAGPLASMHLADFGADVIKIEHPTKPDPARGHGPSKDGTNLWYKTLGRNKRNLTLDLSRREGAEVFLRLIEDADVLIENFRPGVLQRWGLSTARLMEHNSQLVIVRITAFGQDGPYSSRPGFGTLAEAMSGFAASTGDPEGPPTLPPFGLADGITALAAAFAALVGLKSRDQTGEGGEVDMSILEPMMLMLGPQVSAYKALGYIQPRTGNRSVNNAPRNVYKSSDGRWIAVSTSSQSVAERVITMVGHPELIQEPWFQTGHGRVSRADLLDELVGGWIARRPSDQVLRSFEDAEAAAAEVYDVSQLVDDPQVLTRGIIAELDDPDLGRVSMQNPLFKFNGAYPPVKWPGRGHGADRDEILRGIGLTAQQINLLRDRGLV